jgi:hypothetical protein
MSNTLVVFSSVLAVNAIAGYDAITGSDAEWWWCGSLAVAGVIDIFRLSQWLGTN